MAVLKDSLITGDLRVTGTIYGDANLGSLNASGTGLGTNGQILTSTGTGLAWSSNVTPSSHSHGNITNAGELTVANAAVVTDGNKKITTRTIKNMTTVGNLGWTAAATDIYIPTVNTIAYWNGRYNSSNSNLEYCKKGAFGDLAIKSTISSHSVTTPTGATSRTADVALNTTTVNSITAVGTLPSLTITATDVVTGGTTTAIPNISKKTVVTGGTTTNIPNVTAVGSVPSLTYTARSIPNVTAAGTASYANGILTITNTTLGTAIAADDITAWSAGSTPTLGTAIAAYTALTTGDSVTVGTAINAYTALTTSSIGSASGWSAGTLPTKGSNTTVATGIKTQPTFTVTTTTTTLSHTVS